MEKRKRKKIYKLLAILLAVVLSLFMLYGVFCLGTQYQLNDWAYWYPTYEKIDIEPLLDKSERTEEDYATLYAQTGLTEIGIEDTLAQRYGKQTVLRIQNAYFQDVHIYREYVAGIMCQESMTSFATLAHLQDGDVIVTASTVISWWRWGHAAIVVDGDRGLVVESTRIGSDSQCNYASVFIDRPSIMVLRPKVDEETKKQVANYAKENLVGLPYQPTVGILSKKNPKTLKHTQCSHLVWYAYKQYGIDLDSNGGLLVLPQDIANSPYMEVVQIYGFHPEGLWK